MNKVVESLLGFKGRRSPILEARNSILKLLLLVLPLNIILFALVNLNVPFPYMDEYFHEDQLVHYLNSDFRYWNNKITTPPGLYYFGYVASFLNFFDSDPLFLARFLNVFFCSNITLVFFMKIYQYNDINKNNFSRSLALAFTPTIFFFNFLVYTDSLSLMFITCAFYYNITNSRKRLLLCSIGALLSRQNNIVWLLYLMCYRVLIDKNYLFANNRTFLHNVVSIIKLIPTQKQYIFKQFKYQVALIIAFALYLKKYNNGKLVFGDVENHQISFHPTQLLYLSLFIILNLPLTLKQYIVTGTTVIRRIFNSRHALSTFLFLTAISLILVDKFTIVHPFITSDNRHYIFYIYKDLLSKNLIKYGLCVFYPLAMIFIFRLIVVNEETFFKSILLVFCSAAVLTITPLVQFRYFTIPLVLFSLEIKNRKHNIDIQGIHSRQSFGFLDRMWPTVAVKLFINLSIFFVFLYLPYGNQGEYRFMW